MSWEEEHWLKLAEYTDWAPDWISGGRGFNSRSRHISPRLSTKTYYLTALIQLAEREYTMLTHQMN